MNVGDLFEVEQSRTVVRRLMWQAVATAAGIMNVGDLFEVEQSRTNGRDSG